MTLHTQELQTLAQVQAFVSGNEAISFTLTDRLTAYGWMTDTLKQFHYGHCTRANKGLLRRYLLKVTGLSRAQVARCITQFTDGVQFQAVFAVEHISEAYLLPVLAAMMDAFPFVIRGFHSDNGSEYINRNVAELLEKLRIEQAKSRSRQTNDNALAESKNASTVRKYLGYSHVPQHCASQVNTFVVEVLSPSASPLPPLPPPLPFPNGVHGQERANTQALSVSGHDDAL